MQEESCQGSRTRRFSFAYSTCIAAMDEECPAARSIEAFFMNPAFIMDSPKQQSADINKASCAGKTTAHHDSSFKHDLADERPSTTARILNVVDEPFFWDGYTSDEEAASPIALDDWDGTDDDSFSDLPELSPDEEHTASIVSQAHQLCAHARAVTIVSAGRARMVMVPKIIDKSRLECRSSGSLLPNQLQVEPVVLPYSRSHSPDAPENERTSSDYSHKGSLDSFDSASLFSTAPSSIHEQSPKPHRLSVSSKHIPLMEAARHVPLMEAARLGSSNSLISPSSPASLTNSYTWSQHLAPTSAPAVPRSSGSHIKSGVLSALISRFDPADSSSRRNSKIGSSNIGRIGKNILRRDTSESIEDMYASRRTPEPQHSQSRPSSPVVHLPMRSSSIKPSRMVARGANERAPVLTLPTCPHDSSRSFESEWPVWKEGPQSHSARITTVA